MPLSTRSGKTYDSDASSITSSRRAKSTKPARSSKRATSRSGEGKETIPVKSTSSTKGNSTTNSVSRENPSTGKENSDYQESHPDVRTSSGTIAVHDTSPSIGPESSFDTKPALLLGTELPSTPGDDHGSVRTSSTVPTIGSNGDRPSRNPRPHSRGGSFNGYRTNSTELVRKPSNHDIPEPTSPVPNGERHWPHGRHEENSDRVPEVLPRHLETPHLAIRPEHPRRVEPIPGSQARQGVEDQPIQSFSSSEYVSSPDQQQFEPQPRLERQHEGQGQETRTQQLEIPKKDISWRETMAAARALQRAQAQMLEDLRKEEDEKSSKRRRKD
ncbi:hypothetical protein MJO29_012983 [Puccinia striiformis f. sp. tritici]|nr:hypothetical protein MJO29_012983 [Puccinia striiformis f. sp. tritici]